MPTLDQHELQGELSKALEACLGPCLESATARTTREVCKAVKDLQDRVASVIEDVVARITREVIHEEIRPLIKDVTASVQSAWVESAGGDSRPPTSIPMGRIESTTSEGLLHPPPGHCQRRLSNHHAHFNTKENTYHTPGLHPNGHNPPAARREWSDNSSGIFLQRIGSEDEMTTWASSRNLGNFGKPHACHSAHSQNPPQQLGPTFLSRGPHLRVYGGSDLIKSASVRAGPSRPTTPTPRENSDEIPGSTPLPPAAVAPPLQPQGSGACAALRRAATAESIHSTFSMNQAVSVHTNTQSGTTSGVNPGYDGTGTRRNAEAASHNLNVLSRIQQKRQKSTMHQQHDDAIQRILELEDESSVQATLEKCIRSSWFDYTTLLLICLNAISIGWQTDYLARHTADEVPRLGRMVEVTFCILFSAELLLKLYVFRWSFFKRDVKWNVFDALVVLLQVAEEIMNLLAANISLNLSFLRIIRVLRLIRVIRLIRILRLISELRTLVTSLAGSLKAFGWTVILLFMLIYTVAIVFTQLVTDHRIGIEESQNVDVDGTQLPQYFGSLGSSILALFQSILGGVSWREITDPLMGEISTSLGFIFSVYITFCVLAMMNVVTGVFVDSALNSAKHDKEVYMMNSVRAMFLRMKMDLAGNMTWTEFKSLLTSAEMVEYFKAIDVDISEAQSIFELLDVDNSGTLTAEEFITGCLRLQGTAKALDLTVLMSQVRDLGNFLSRLFVLVEEVAHHVKVDQVPMPVEEPLPLPTTSLTKLGSPKLPGTVQW